jgi:4-amino-4-deoxy-L-arabinose transferase-like glycosyltransferase
MAPLGTTVGLIVVILSVPVLVPSANEWRGWALLPFVPLAITVPVGVAAAVLRLNLYAIDHVVSRTVSYMIVVVVLAGVYGAATISLGTAMSSLTGRTENELVVAVSVLAVAAVFHPVRSRTRHLVERKFNRSGFERARVVGHYLDGLDGQVAVDEIEEGLAETIASAFQPVHVTLWLAPESETHDGSGGATHRSVARSLMR